MQQLFCTGDVQLSYENEGSIEEYNGSIWAESKGAAFTFTIPIITTIYGA